MSTGLQKDRQGDLMVGWAEMPRSPGHDHVVKRAYLDGNVQERKWQALVIRVTEITAFDIDDTGNLIVHEDEREEPKPKPGRKRASAKSKPRKGVATV